MAHSNEHTAGCCAHCSCSNHEQKTEHDNELNSSKKVYIPAVLSFVLLLIGLSFDYFISNSFFTGYVRLAWYIIAYIPVGFPVLKDAFELMLQKDFFNEFSLMGIATLGAFAIGEYPEGVAVMLFYAVGELFQDSAVNKAKNNIKALLDIRPDSASVLRNGTYQNVAPESVEIGETIQVKAGEKVPLDGVLLSAKSSFNTSALTGESKPKSIKQDEPVLAGMLNLDNVIEIKVEKLYSDSSLAKILDLVQNASTRKAKTELLIRKFAKIYTPIVFLLALAITVLPLLFVSDYVFKIWLYRALVFLVISCPCALVISIPLGYFGGIGAASRYGILFKGANYLEIMTKVNTVVMDKTGTLTQGVFQVQEISSPNMDKQVFINTVAALESNSTHPIAKAITEYSKGSHIAYPASNVEEISGHGLCGTIDGKRVLAGNTKLMQKRGVVYDKKIDSIVETIVVVAIDNVYSGYITIADEIKDDAKIAIEELHSQGIKKIVMLSGDKQSIADKIAGELGIDDVSGNLLPEDKVEYIEKLKADKNNVVAFVGDGINDAPSLALSDVGIAMGGMGSDAAIEIADVIIQTDQPSRIAVAIKISKATRQIVIQNIILAFSIKLLVLLLGAMGIATMWEAVFADVGVALLAILNAVRILNKKF